MYVELQVYVELYGPHEMQAFSQKNYEVTARGRVVIYIGVDETLGCAAPPGLRMAHNLIDNELPMLALYNCEDGGYAI